MADLWADVQANTACYVEHGSNLLLHVAIVSAVSPTEIMADNVWFRRRDGVRVRGNGGLAYLTACYPLTAEYQARYERQQAQARCNELASAIRRLPLANLSENELCCHLARLRHALERRRGQPT